MGQETTNQGAIRQDAGTYAITSRLWVPTTAEHAFTIFTLHLADWWVREYTWSGPDALVDIGLEAGEDGMAYEIGPHGFRADWGRVLVWNPPNRLVFTWQIGPDRAPVPDPAQASEVEVQFRPERRDRTRVEVEHRHFDRHGSDAEGYREALTAGWHELLSRYAAAVSTTAAGHSA